ncbi:isocitrate lyase family protein [Nocardia nova SH22a]|uniref:Isocitrate lyase family protein n=2 Tax=Nocardia nova TaxID=37330 RepID=W5THI5_9NOCA|nr:isocitrate lyase family protein [Nocardia nova SH22a]
MKKTTQLRRMVDSDRIHIAPGVFDGLTARLAEQAGFDLIYASGGAISRSAGFPDLGLLSFTEVCSRLEQMAAVTTTPIIADADTGFGNAANAARTVTAFERLGMAGMHIEDQTFPKRCGHLDDKTLVPIEEMTHKIRVVKQAQNDPDFVLIARTDAIAAEGFDAALHRARAYAEAGADVLFVEAPESVEQIRRIAAELPQPKLINMFYSGKTPLVPKDELRELGYRLIIIPSDLQRATITACRRTLDAIFRDGDSSARKNDMVSFADREHIIGTEQYLNP